MRIFLQIKVHGIKGFVATERESFFVQSIHFWWKTNNHLLWTMVKKWYQFFLVIVFCDGLYLYELRINSSYEVVTFKKQKNFIQTKKRSFDQFHREKKNDCLSYIQAGFQYCIHSRLLLLLTTGATTADSFAYSMKKECILFYGEWVLLRTSKF